MKRTSWVLMVTGICFPESACLGVLCSSMHYPGSFWGLSELLVETLLDVLSAWNVASKISGLHDVIFALGHVFHPATEISPFVSKFFLQISF